MCGICGIYRSTATDPATLRAAAGRMCEAIAHRGPDDGGIYGDWRVGLGNRRLAIIDLSPLGHQPMADDRGEIWVTYNGEIYNFQTLRDELSAKGYRFQSRTDTEVLLYLYREYGLGMLERLRGMFALAFWDTRRQELLLARDRLGIKPLYYAQTAQGVVFASEIKALLAAGMVDPTPQMTALAAFLRMGSVPGPLTAAAGVQELPPGCLLRIRNGTLGLSRYWELPPPEPGRYDAAAVAAELRQRLVDAVESHLVSDVPLGVFLSGGLDSSSLVALMRAAGHEHIRTFAIAFGEGVSEGAYASAVARHFHTDHTETVITAADLLADLDRIIEAMDQPTVDGFNTYFVSKLTRASGTIVALSGLGGDELFAGYPSFQIVPRLRQARRWLRAVPMGIPAASWLLHRTPGGRVRKLHDIVAGDGGLGAAYLGVRGLFTTAEVRELVEDRDLATAAGALTPEEILPPLPAFGDPIADVGSLEMRSYMHNQLLRDTDVMSMMHSLEVRVPLLDHPLVEFVARLPGPVRQDRRLVKGLLVRAVGALLPGEITRRAKRGFTFPLDHWLRGALRPVVEESLAEASRHGGLFRRQAVFRHWETFLAGQTHWSRIWAILVADRWLAHRRRPTPPQPTAVSR